MFVTGHAMMTPQVGWDMEACHGNLSRLPFGMIGAGMRAALRQSSPRMGRGMLMILIAITNKDAMPCREKRKRT